ncbi:Pregnancy-associated plasma protein-A [Microdochium nivale]|nr:Pregnancy-associated plasma protein-A [Microdochium nivale]
MVKFSVAATAVLSAASALARPSPEEDRFDCGTEKPSKEFLAASQSMAAAESFAKGSMSIQAAIEVDLYLHVVTSGTGLSQGNVPDSQLAQQVVVLNQDFAPHSIHFNLRGTDRTINSTWANNVDPVAMRTALHKGSYSALNVYIEQSMPGLLGRCTYPGTASPRNTLLDGCAILYSTVPGGTSTRYNLGKTLTHEVGHWFGLLHPFEGGCTGSNDMIADTPATNSTGRNCPAARDSCPDDPGFDPVHNHMDYSWDTCYEGFTAGQEARMVSMWNRYRAGK